MEQRDPTLNWPEKFGPGGKPREAGRWDLPFQVIETINENRATRESREKGIQKSLFDIWKGDEGQSFDQGWKNKLIWGDNKYVMSSLLQRFAGKVDLIYIDPPFNTGRMQQKETVRAARSAAETGRSIRSSAWAAKRLRWGVLKLNTGWADACGGRTF
jgi:hypothetical protein